MESSDEPVQAAETVIKLAEATVRNRKPPQQELLSSIFEKTPRLIKG